jgi:hypothetical protein
MVDIDVKCSNAVLIAASEFPRDNDLNSLPQSKNSAIRLNELLAKPSLLGLAHERIDLIINPDDPSYVYESVDRAAQEATDTLIFYYSGHGLIGQNSSLYLATRRSIQDKAELNSVEWDRIRCIILRSRAQRRIVILDCCFSGIGIKYMSGRNQGLRAGLSNIRGLFSMAAAPATVLALAPIGATYTAFSGALIDVVENGIPCSDSELSLEALFDAIKYDRIPKIRGAPEPFYVCTDGVEELKFVYNLGYCKEAIVIDPPSWIQKLIALIVFIFTKHFLRLSLLVTLLAVVTVLAFISQYIAIKQRSITITTVPEPSKVVISSSEEMQHANKQNLIQVKPVPKIPISQAKETQVHPSNEQDSEKPKLINQGQVTLGHPFQEQVSEKPKSENLDTAPQPLQSIPERIEYTVYVGRYRGRTSAQYKANELSIYDLKATVQYLDEWYRVKAAVFDSADKAQALKLRLEQNGYKYVDIVEQSASM